MNTRLTMWYVMLRYGEPAMALTDAIATRFRETLPPDRYEISTSGLAVTIQRRDVPQFTVGTPAVMLGTPCSSEEKLRRALQTAADMVRKYVSPDEISRVQVTADVATVWWGGPSERDATVRWRSIRRADIGI
jgi:hypothetical protein